MSKSLEKINFIGSAVQDSNAYRTLVNCWASGFIFQDAAEILRRQGYYLPEDQYRLFCQLLDTQLSMDIGHRQNEVTHAA